MKKLGGRFGSLLRHFIRSSSAKAHSTDNDTRSELKRPSILAVSVMFAIGVFLRFGLKNH